MRCCPTNNLTKKSELLKQQEGRRTGYRALTAMQHWQACQRLNCTPWDITLKILLPPFSRIRFALFGVSRPLRSVQNLTQCWTANPATAALAGSCTGERRWLRQMPPLWLLTPPSCWRTATARARSHSMWPTGGRTSAFLQVRNHHLKSPVINGQMMFLSGTDISHV